MRHRHLFPRLPAFSRARPRVRSSGAHRRRHVYFDSASSSVRVVRSFVRATTTTGRGGVSSDFKNRTAGVRNVFILGESLVIYVDPDFCDSCRARKTRSNDIRLTSFYSITTKGFVVPNALSLPLVVSRA